RSPSRYDVAGNALSLGRLPDGGAALAGAAPAGVAAPGDTVHRPPVSAGSRNSGPQREIRNKVHGSSIRIRVWGYGSGGVTGLRPPVVRAAGPRRPEGGPSVARRVRVETGSNLGASVGGGGVGGEPLWPCSPGGC